MLERFGSLFRQWESAVDFPHLLVSQATLSAENRAALNLIKRVHFEQAAILNVVMEATNSKPDVVVNRQQLRRILKIQENNVKSDLNLKNCLNYWF